MARKKKRDIIPIEKRKNVIKLEDRGRERVLKRSAWTFGILGLLCVLYCVSIWAFWAMGVTFS